MNKALFTLAVMAVFTSPVHAAPWCNGSLDAMSVSSWKIAAVDSQTNRLEVTVESHFARPVRMVDAAVGFVDALGDEIGRFALTRDVTLGPDETYTQTALWGLHTFERLLALEHAEVGAFVCVKAVLYADGSKEAFGSNR